MPHRLKARQEKIQNKRKQTPWRDFVKEIASWNSMVYYNYDGNINRVPDTERTGKKLSYSDFFNSNKIEKNIQKKFLGTLTELFQEQEYPMMCHYTDNENCIFADTVYACKNIYLTNSAINGCEDVLYSYNIKDSCKRIVNSIMIWDSSENIYYSSIVLGSQNIFYSCAIRDSYNVWFSTNLVGCQNCIFCDNLENKQYCIENKQYTKEEYEKKVVAFRRNKIKYSHWQHAIFKRKINTNFLSENLENSIGSYRLFNGRNTILVGGKEGSRDIYDCYTGGAPKASDFYGVMGAGMFSEHLYCCNNIANSTHCFYSGMLENCSYCLGCIGLKNKSYCILNKQYTKEERYDKVDEIFTQMEKDGTLGKFFLGSMNPFYFNDTAAYLIDDSFTKEEVEAEGYLRRDEKIKVDIPEGAEIVYVNPPQSPFSKGGSEAGKETSNSPSLLKRGSGGDSLDHYQGRKVNGKFYPISEIGNKVPKVESGAERWIDPEILKKVIQDKEGNYYKIVKMEYDFLMKHRLPLPKLHWLDRIKLGFKFK